MPAKLRTGKPQSRKRVSKPEKAQAVPAAANQEEVQITMSVRQLTRIAPGLYLMLGSARLDTEKIAVTELEGDLVGFLNNALPEAFAKLIGAAGEPHKGKA